MAMSTDYRIVDIRAGPGRRGDRIVLDDFPAGDAPEPAAANQRAVDAIEAPPPYASVLSATDTQDTFIPNGWFG